MTVAQFEEAIHGEYDREFDEVLTAEYPEQEARGFAGHPSWEDERDMLAELRDMEALEDKLALQPYDPVECVVDGHVERGDVLFAPFQVNGVWMIRLIGWPHAMPLSRINRVPIGEEGEALWSTENDGDEAYQPYPGK